MTKATCGGKGLFDLHFHATVHHGRKSGQELRQDRNVETGADTEAMEWCCLLGCSSWSLLSLLSYRIQEHQPRDTHPQRAKSFPVNH